MDSTSSPPRKRIRETNDVSLDQCPRSVNVTEFVEARALEITQLLAVIDNAALPAGEVAQGPRTFVQRLPRHLRRRAMSYNLKRLPRRLRPMAEATVKESKHRKKPPSRRWRRRPSNLLNAYVRRQRRVQWLETHIWHAKRFHMVDFFGWRLPDRSCQRGFRASFRDAARHCVVQDVSFYVCLELEGPEKILIDRLNRLCQPSVSHTFSNASALSGAMEGRAILFQPGSYPTNCIGPVQFMYQPKIDQENRRLWIWIHPSLESKVLETLVGLFQLAECEKSPGDQKLVGDQPKSFQNGKEFQASRLFSPPTYRSIDDSFPIALRILKHHLVRFRLIGPKSGLVLSQVLNQPQSSSWPTTFTKNGSPAAFGDQWRFWNDFYGKADVGTVQPGSIFPLVVSDPRLFTNYKKQLPNTDGSKLIKGLPTLNPSNSPIWSDAVRRFCLESKLSDNELNQLRPTSGFGKRAALETSSHVPMLLIQQPASNSGTHLGFGAGWDLILPAGFGMPFWIALQYATARAVGLDFQRHFSMEATDQRLGFPHFWPDSESGQRHAEKEEAALRNRYFRQPINRRVDYERLRITHPFICPWNQLLNGWTTSLIGNASTDNGFYVLRDRIILRKLERIFDPNVGRRRPPANESILPHLISQHQRALVAVRLSSVGKGVPKSRALICLPTEEDLPKIRSKQALQPEMVTSKKSASDVEIIDKPTATEREFIKLDSVHVGVELDLETLFEDKKAKRLDERKLNEKQRKKRRKLPKMEEESCEVKTAKFGNLIDSCDRRIFGYVVDGDFAFSSGRGQAVGFCSLSALTQLKETRSKFVLYRNVRSKYYRAATIDILN